jgi:hypothetical protein
MVEQAGENPLRHPPDDCILELEGGDIAALAANLESHGVVGIGPQELIQLDPASGCDLNVGKERRAVRQEKHVGANRDGRKNRSSGYDVFQDPEQMAPIQLEPDLFVRFSNGSGE